MKISLKRLGLVVLISAFIFEARTLLADSNCTSSEVNYGSAEFQTNVSLYQAAVNSPKSLIIIPPTGGTNEIDRKYADQFCGAGYNVYILNHWTDDTETRIDLDIHQSFYLKAQKAISLVVHEIRSPYIGLLGTSVGALHASIAASTQERISAIFSIVGGTPISEVAAKSDHPTMIKLREERFKKYGFKDEDEYAKAIDQEFTLEPAALGTKFKNKHLGLVIAEKDQTVPYDTQLKLKELWKPETVIVISDNHFWGVVKTWLFERNQVLAFFENGYKNPFSKPANALN